MKKSLGQNFLVDKKIVQKIIESSDLKPEDFILEIGPGEGILTEELEKKSGQVIAIEIDQGLTESLRKKFQDKDNIEIVEGDILKKNITKVVGEKKYKVIANIPYYITAPIIRLFLESERKPEEMVLMVQKEVAERIVALPGKMSILSVSVQYYAEVEILFEVGKEAFNPVPEVDSAVIRIKNIQKKDDSKKFFQIVRAGFSAKRKTLLNNLSNSLHLEKDNVENVLKKSKIDKNARAQELSIDDWKILSELL